MDNDQNKGKTSKYVNWVTVWGFIFGCIAFNLYVDNRQSRQNIIESCTQYEIESQRADSLYKETIRLEHRLHEIETKPTEKLSISQSTDAHKRVSINEL